MIEVSFIKITMDQKDFEDVGTSIKKESDVIADMVSGMSQKLSNFNINPSVPEPIAPNDSSSNHQSKPDKLKETLMLTLKKLYCQYPESLPFRQPIDPQVLGIPDYFDIVKKPMDLSTIKRKLETGQYNDPTEYVDDVWLMFENTWLYNRKTSKVYRYCTKLSEIFDKEIDPVMQALGYRYMKKY